MNGLKSKFATTKTFWWLIGIVLLSLVLRDLPVFSFIFAPFNQFEVFLHEMSHAIACVFTGGWVSGLTIVEDGKGHGGLTFTHGGIPFIYSQAGYIGETLWGCLLIALSRFPRLSRAILITIGVGMALVSIYFMTGAMFMPGMFLQAIGSLIWGLAISAGLIWVGAKLSERWAHPLLLFIAVQSCLSSLSGVWVLFLQSMGAFPGTWSDATNMERMTHIPAMFWGVSWAIFSVSMLVWVMWLTYKADQAQGKNAAIGVQDKKAIAADPQVKRISAAAAVDAELMQLRQSVAEGEKIKVKKKNR